MLYSCYSRLVTADLILAKNKSAVPLSFLYDINTVLLFSLIYSILFSTNIVERMEKKKNKNYSSIHNNS